MSGALSAGFSLAGIAFALFGSVTVAGFTAFGFEVPEHINFGGAQKVNVHKLLGGDRVVDVMGPDEADISWSGIMSGPLAQIRAMQLDQIRRAGQAVPLVFGGQSRQAIVTAFKVSIEHGGFLWPYSITCLVLPPTPPASPSAASASNGNASDTPVSTSDSVTGDAAKGTTMSTAAKTSAPIADNGGFASGGDYNDYPVQGSAGPTSGVLNE